jgi:hypothetical protein
MVLPKASCWKGETMLTEHINRWRDIIARVSQHAGWDKTLLTAVAMDESTFAVYVRKSALRFVILESFSDPSNFAISYTTYASGSPSELAQVRFEPSVFHAAVYVDDELEKWLLQSVSRYVSERGSPD